MNNKNSRKIYLVLAVIFLNLIFFGFVRADTEFGGDWSGGYWRCDSSGVKDCYPNAVNLSDNSFQAYRASITTTIDNWIDRDDGSLSAEMCLRDQYGGLVNCFTPIGPMNRPNLYPTSGASASIWSNDGGNDGGTVFSGEGARPQDQESSAVYATFHIRVDSIYTHSSFAIYGRRNAVGNPTCVSNYNDACNSNPNVCGQTNPGTILCAGGCSASAPADSACGGTAKYRCGGGGSGACVRDDVSGTMDSSCGGAGGCPTWGPWSGCSPSCGPGTQTRTCSGGDLNCQESPSNPSSQACNLGNCSGSTNGACAGSHWSCTAGTPANAAGSGPWTWNCNGSGGGSNASCSEGGNPPAVVNGSCSSSHYNCSTGSSSNNSNNSDTWSWNCNGSGGGSNAGCSEHKPVDCVWGGWGACSVSACGWTGSQSRPVAIPAQYGGAACVGLPTQSCSMPLCTVNFSGPGSGSTIIYTGQSTTLTWSSPDATQCTGTFFNTNENVNGSVIVSPISTTTYSISCSSGATPTVKTWTVTVKKRPIFIEN